MADSAALKELKERLRVAVRNLEIAQEHQEIARTELACANESVVACNVTVGRLKRFIENERPLNKMELRILSMAQTDEGYQLDYEATPACSAVRVLTTRNLVSRGSYNCLSGFYHATKDGIQALADARNPGKNTKKRGKLWSRTPCPRARRTRRAR